MSEEQEEFANLMQRLRNGSEEAARELLDRFGSYILRVVRRRLSRELRSKYDSVDFVQAVWASFFAEDSQDRRFDHPDALIAFLATLAQNKVIDAVRRPPESAVQYQPRVAVRQTLRAAGTEVAGARSRRPARSRWPRTNFSTC